MMLHITLQQIETFLAVAEHLNFSAAAKALYISQPALSKSIGRFEESLGVKLFVRCSHGVRLTDEGEILYSELRLPINRIHKVVSNVQNIKSSKRKYLRIGCHSAFGKTGIFTEVKEIIRQYEMEYPDVTVLIELSEYPFLNNMLIAGGVDVIISTTIAVASVPLVSTKNIGRVKFFLAMSAAHPLAKCDDIDISQLRNETFCFISTDDTQSSMSELTRCKHIGFMPKNILPLPNFESVIMAVRQGKGLTFSGHFGADEEYPDLKFFPLPELQRPEYIVVAWRTEDMNPQTRAFTNMSDWETADENAFTPSAMLKI